MAVIDRLDVSSQQRLGIDHGSAVLRRACVFILLLAVAAGAFCAVRKDVTRGFDELAHASYVAAIQESGTLWPSLEKLPMLDPASFQFTGRANYLNHPSPYYALLALLGPSLVSHPAAIVIDRLFNVVIVTAGLAALLMIGLAARLPPSIFYAYAVPLVCIPVLLPLAGAVNPDNAAFAGGALALLGAWQFVATGRSMWLWAALAGVVIASWAKLTGLLLAGTMLACVLGWCFGRGKFKRDWIIPILVAVALASAPYVAFIVQYGSPAPDTPGQSMMLKQAAHAAGWDQARQMSPLAYALFFVLTFTMEWMPTLTPRDTLNYVMLVLPLGAALCAMAGVVLSARRVARRSETVLDVVVVAGALAFAATFIIHGIFSYERYVTIGWLMDAYPRYYLPVAGVVPLAALSLLNAIGRGGVRTALIVFMIIGPIAFRVLGAPLA